MCLLYLVTNNKELKMMTLNNYALKHAKNKKLHKLVTNLSGE